MNEIAQLKANTDIVKVIDLAIPGGLKKKGREHVGLCPFHDDHKPSLYVNRSKQVFYCPACGEKGDVFAFLMATGKTFIEAKEYLIDSTGNIELPKQKKKVEKASKPYRQILPKVPAGQITHWKHGKPSSIWEYKTATGQLIGYVCRFDFANGGKEILPYTFQSDGTNNNNKWMFKGFAKPRALYNLDQINARPGATIVLVEGEKTADAVTRLLPHAIGSTWQGGANAIGMADFSPLHNRKVLLWPDNDKEQRYGSTHELAGQLKPFHEQPGNKAMLIIAEMISEKTKVLKWIFNADYLPNKWDLADADDWTPDDARKYAKEHLRDVPFPQNEIIVLPDNKQKKTEETPDKPGPAEPIEHQPPGAPAPTEPTGPQNLLDSDGYFSFLGYEKDGDTILHCLYVKESRTVHKYSAGRLYRLSTLIQLAPLDFWEDTFGSGRQNKVKMEAALNWICRVSHETGFFSNEKLRGRGAWIDDGRVVVHAGEHLMVNNKKVRLGEIKSRYIYEAAPDIGFGINEPLQLKEANKVVQICELLNWDRLVNSYLLAGWCIIAPICGSLPWRSHIWVTGPAGSGKSWVLKNIIRVLLGDTALAVQSETSEPGLRQLLKSDALPVVFDEAEGEDLESTRRMQKVIGLMRAASADDGGFLAKGTSGGDPKKYRIRSCFAFASIGITATQQSDKTRITILSLNSPKNSEIKKQRWEQLQKLYAETINEDYAKRLQARTLQMLPIILKNAAVFASAVAGELGEQRIGDQIGILLAGVYSLYSNHLITYEAAVEWIKGKDWSEERTLDANRDENRCLAYLLQKMIRVDRPGGPAVERTIGELIAGAWGGYQDENVMEDLAEKKLNRLGFQVYDEISNGEKVVYVIISNTSESITNMLKFTPWANNHNKIFERIDGAIKTNAKRFVHGHISRGVGIPIDNVLMAEPPPVKDQTELPF